MLRIPQRYATNLKAALAAAMLFAAFGLAGTGDYVHALELDALEKVARVERALEVERRESSQACAQALVACFRGATLSNGDLFVNCFPVRVRNDEPARPDAVLRAAF